MGFKKQRLYPNSSKTFLKYMQIEFTDVAVSDLSETNNVFEFDQSIVHGDHNFLQSDIFDSPSWSENPYDPVQISNDLESILVDLLEQKKYLEILIYTGSDLSFPSDFNFSTFQKFKSKYSEAISINPSILFYRYLVLTFNTRFRSDKNNLKLSITKSEYYSKLSKKLQTLDFENTTFSKISRYLMTLKNYFDSIVDSSIESAIKEDYESRLSENFDNISYEDSSYEDVDQFESQMYIKDEDVLGGSSVVSKYKEQLLKDKDKSAMILSKKNISYEKAKSVLKTAGLSSFDSYDILGRFAKINAYKKSPKKSYRNVSLSDVKIDKIEF